ncbi:hypothetical protein [Corynebacterium atypicum]|uniref:hypothetical protein n=1 Tax=Corynebacterium atypicum TaxID=191610 RepID=UPI000AC0BC7B|nr:hypothetical protein [Corynebacterium atypicum]
MEGVSPALVIDRTVEEDNDVLTETTTLDTGDVFTSVLDRPTSILKAYYNGRLVNEVNLDVVFEEMVVSEGGPSAVQSRSWQCNTIEWLAYGNTAVWGIVAALFPPSVVAAAIGGTLTGAALLAAKQACEARIQ